MLLTDELFLESVQYLLTEAKKAEKGPKARVAEAQPHGFFYNETYDFSQPLGADNLYHRQGMAAWGPDTHSPSGINVKDDIVMNKDVFRFKEGLLRTLESGVIDEQLAPSSSAWEALNLQETYEHTPADGSAWTDGYHWYDYARIGLGEGHVGFKKLAQKLSHKKGVESGSGLAAAIGRKKLGKKEMARRSAAGRK
jgi:hypothetical protein